jgi:hypothetical protein
VCRNWDETVSKEDDPFAHEFLRLVNGETDDTTDFLRELPMNPFGNKPSDSQEALLYILDRIEKYVPDFTGEMTQTVIYPGGRSITKNPCCFWFRQEKLDVLSGYEDTTGRVHNAAAIERKLTRLPEVLVSDVVQDELFGKPLVGVVQWGFGHYVAYSKEAGDWWYANDEHIKKSDPIKLVGYIGFYGVGKTHTPRTRSQET